MTFLLAVVIGYLLGSVPTGLIIGRVHGVDPRQVGSGRTGGTNVYRAAGPVAGVSTAFIDIFKSTIAMWLVYRFIEPSAVAVSLAGIAAVAGHNWSLFLGFKGGAGTMTNAGGLIWISWPLALLGGIIAGLTLLLSRMSSLASLVFAFFVPLGLAVAAYLGYLDDRAYILYGVGTVLLITYSLRPNIGRILAGTERRIGQPRNE